jgi:N-acylneuraminate cytidylyltransferase
LKKQSCLAIIPARGGSKRIPRKNIKDFLGKPVISYSIDAVLNSGLFSEVMVSTDDEEIANIAKHLGVPVPFLRSEKTSNDYATTIEVLLEVYNNYQSEEKRFDKICCVYPCAPFVTSKQLQTAFNLMIQKKAFTVFPIIKYGHPIQRALLESNGLLEMIDPEKLTVRTQDLEPHFHDAGQFYWLTSNSLLRDKKLITSRTMGIEISELEAHDIDSELDWKLAELKYSLLKLKS